MFFFNSRAIFFLICLVTNNTVNAKPLYKPVDPKRLREEHISSALFNQRNDSKFNIPNIEESNPKEVQKAVCTVTAGDVKASAEAVTTKALKGVCGSAEMFSAFSSLEHFLKKELQDIRELLILLHQKKHDFPDQNISESSNKPPVTFNTTNTSIKLQNFPLENKYSLYDAIKNNSVNSKLKAFQVKDIPNSISLPSTVRKHEISLFNNTLLTDRDIKVFTYYWRMENFTSRIANGNSITVASPMFSIKGSAFQIKAYFQHLHRDFLFLQLENISSSHVSLANSIILDTGGIFKEIDGNNFKYKISILNQNKKRSGDLVSQELDNHDKGFLIPNSALLDTSFVTEDALLIQIFLYL